MRLFILIFFYTIPFFCQNNSGTIIYEGALNFNLEKNISKVKDSLKTESKPLMNKTFTNVLKNMRPLSYVLHFNRKESLFEKENSLEDPTSNRLNITNALGAKGKYYANMVKKNVINSVYAFGDDFRVYQSIENFNWQIKNESKRINSFICYKAVGERKLKNSKGEFTEEVIAWFTPNIPYSFGPADFVGLPGLILELSTKNFKYRAIKIELNKSNIELKEPSKGRKVTKEEFDRLCVKYAKEMGFK